MAMQTIRGMRDILPSEIPQWRWIELLIAQWMQRYGYQEIRTPIVEYAELFYHGVGTDTDAVGKEMYVFPDRSGEQLALRPELTAPVARAIIQHALHKQSPTLRLWYYGPCFRYERPQKGRQRQFHQVGAECLGYTEPDADAEIISLAWDLASSASEADTIELVINTLGTEAEQQRYREHLVRYFEQFAADLSDVSRQRLHSNPLRILDSKDERDRRIIEAAPLIMDVLSAESVARYEATKTLLREVGIPYREDPYLVRGLDYYTHTVFELRSRRLGAQDAVGGGGRYDTLLSRLGGDRVPGVGFGIGVERLLLSSTKLNDQPQWQRLVFVAADQSQNLAMHRVLRALRSHDIPCTADFHYRSLKAQLRQANKLRCQLAVLVGIPDEHLTIKDMRTGHQDVIPLSSIDSLFERINSAEEP